MRPIDADALYQEMIKTIANMMRTRRWLRKDESNEEEILSVIQNAPPLDYAPVKRGEWKKCGQLSRTQWLHRCSLCGCPQDYAHNFCPNCGASMMDGGKKDG